MTHRHQHRARARDHVPVLHNSGPAAQSVYHTGAVGHAVELPVDAIVSYWLMRGGGKELLPPLGKSTGGRIDADQLYVAVATALLTLDPTGTGHRALARERDRRRPLERGVSHDGGQVSAQHDVLALLERLHARLTALGAIAPFHGIVHRSAPDGFIGYRFPAEMPDITPWLRVSGVDVSVRVAWWLLAIAHLAPPALLWHRAPSLHHYGRCCSISVRWFGQPVGA